MLYLFTRERPRLLTGYAYQLNSNLNESAGGQMEFNNRLFKVFLNRSGVERL